MSLQYGFSFRKELLRHQYMRLNVADLLCDTRIFWVIFLAVERETAVSRHTYPNLELFPFQNYHSWQTTYGQELILRILQMTFSNTGSQTG